MNKIKVKDILKVTGGTLIYGNEEEECESFCRNTKEIETGDIYIGFKGEKFDGIEFYEEALENGAKGCIVNKVEGKEFKQIKGKFIIEVADTVEAIGKIAKLKRRGTIKTPARRKIGMTQTYLHILSESDFTNAETASKAAGSPSLSKVSCAKDTSLLPTTTASALSAARRAI